MKISLLQFSSIPGSGRSPGEGNGNPLRYSCLENPMDWGAWWTTVHRVAKSQTLQSTGSPGVGHNWGTSLLLSPSLSVQLLSHVRLLATPWTTVCQASLSITNSWSLLKLMSIMSVMPSNHLFLCYPLLPPSIFPSIRIFFKESVLHIR